MKVPINRKMISLVAKIDFEEFKRIILAQRKAIISTSFDVAGCLFCLTIFAYLCCLCTLCLSCLPLYCYNVTMEQNLQRKIKEKVLEFAKMEGNV